MAHEFMASDTQGVKQYCPITSEFVASCWVHMPIGVSEQEACALCSERAALATNGICVYHESRHAMLEEMAHTSVRGFITPRNTRAFIVFQCVVNCKAATHYSSPKLLANGPSLCQWPGRACTDVNTESKGLHTQCLADFLARAQEIKRHP